ncbi:MAG: Nif3-like dinuclear metal center hexameric protein [Alphaproteobacteria bacterium]|nr:MAG: Nif3-like dinuclear metal center hexameric protein [Alphaproteobacteria bacterium]
MHSLDEIVSYLEQELRTSAIPDYPVAVNGLQLANSGKIERVVAAVDASLPVIEKAAAGGPGLLVVHHGMFWQGVQPVTGAFYRKLKIAMDADLAIYSSHLPLDIHPEWGNNILLARAIGLDQTTPFLDQKGMAMGLRGKWEGSREELAEKLQEILGGRVHVCPGGPQLIREIGIATGGTGSEVVKAAASGVDAFVTGEGPHWSYPLAEELGLNVFYGGHYATETFGVKKLAEIISGRTGMPFSFIDHPTGL